MSYSVGRRRLVHRLACMGQEGRFRNGADTHHPPPPPEVLMQKVVTAVSAVAGAALCAR